MTGDKILIALLSFSGMEFVAWFTHKYIMHGFLWHLHKDHHESKKPLLEKNDTFFLIFSIPGALLVFNGADNGFSDVFYIGLGITIYGFAYFTVHDIFIHQRFKLFRNTKNTYLLALRRAHKIHHKKTMKENGECFGMLIVPLKYFDRKANNLVQD